MLLSVKQAADVIGCAEQRVRYLIEQGQFGGIIRHKHRTTYTITDTQLAQWLGIDPEEIRRRLEHA